MVLLVCLGCVALVAGVSGYLVIGRNRYGGKRSGRPLELGASQSALRQGSVLPEPCRTIRVYFIKPSRYDESGYVQPTRDMLAAVRGLNSTYHCNAIKTWKVAADGSVSNA